MSSNAKLNFRLSDVIRAAFGLAMIDGGFVIAVQIITFLLNYFGANLQLDEQGTSIIGISKTTFLVSLIGMLNLAVVIYRMSALARGIKHSPAVCYQQAFRRWPIMILLYVIGSLLLLAVVMPLVHLSNSVSAMASLNYNKFFMFGMLMLIPYGILACIFVIDQDKNPLQAIMATLEVIRQKISMRLLLNVSMLYALPLSVSSLITSSFVTPYLGLFNAVWFLFCHTVIVVIYTGATIVSDPENAKQKVTKVLIV